MGAEVIHELAFVYVDCGEPFYKLATHEMVSSVRRVMPNAKITQISDSKTPAHPFVDALRQADVSVAREKVTLFKGIMFSEHGGSVDKTETQTVFCDVDLIWNHDIFPLFSELNDTGIGLMKRDDILSMPFNTGVVLSDYCGAVGSPHTAQWWHDYRNIIEDLDIKGMGGWYCDQIAAVIADHKMQATHFPMDLIADAPSEKPSEIGKAYCTHFKGARKNWLLDYARMVA